MKKKQKKEGKSATEKKSCVIALQNMCTISPGVQRHAREAYAEDVLHSIEAATTTTTVDSAFTRDSLFHLCFGGCHFCPSSFRFPSSSVPKVMMMVVILKATTVVVMAW